MGLDAMEHVFALTITLVLVVVLGILMWRIRTSFWRDAFSLFIVFVFWASYSAAAEFLEWWFYKALFAFVPTYVVLSFAYIARKHFGGEASQANRIPDPD